MKSMTGYGQATIELADCQVSIEISSVNKKGLEFVLQAPKEWQAFERTAQNLVRQKVDRGRIRLTLSVDTSHNKSTPHLWNMEAMDGELDNLEQYCQSRNIPFVKSAELVERLANSCRQESHLPTLQSAEKKLIDGVSDAMENLIAMRKEEGSLLKQDISNRIGIVISFVEQIKHASEGVAEEWKNRLLKRLQESGLELDTSDDRVLKEFTIFADKSDISEEITRISSHFDQFQECLSSDKPTGRKLEFILQELGREFNTLGSKSVRPACSELAINAKVELEKIREQVLNIE